MFTGISFPEMIDMFVQHTQVRALVVVGKQRGWLVQHHHIQKRSRLDSVLQFHSQEVQK